MTQPRKEQVKNLKTKYTRFTGVGTLAIGGGPVQSVSNTVLEAFYDNFLSVTRTGVVGGAEASAPAILYGGSGPYVLAAGNSLTLAIADLNGGAPMLVTIQAGDIVTLGGSPVVTTSRMADRINQVCAGFGATVPVAANLNGQLVLTSAAASGVTVGDSAVMTITEVTAGILNVLGFSLLGAASAGGTTAPKRGVVTVSADGMGGTVQLRKVDTTVPDAVNSVVRHALAGVYVPDYGHGQPVYARLQAFPGPVINGRNLRFSFFRNGPVRPHAVTSQAADKSNFSSLTGGDSVAVALNFGNGQSLNFNVSFASITTVQGVVDRFNTSFSSASLTATSSQIDSTIPQVIFRMAGPYRFTDQATKDSFFFSLNGNTPIHVNPASGSYSAAQLATLIGTAITTAGQGAQGQAFVYTSPSGALYVGIRSLNTDVTASSVRVSPGNPGGSVPGQYMETLDMLGVAPGLYKAGTVAELYGLDEVDLHCPSPLPDASLSITGSALTMQKLGLPSSVTVSTANGVQACVSPVSHTLTPEMVEFHEERDDYDSVVQDFDNKSPFNQVRPQDGTANVGLDQLLGSDGKLIGSLVPKLLEFLSLDQVKLGSRMLNNLTSASLTPKLGASHDYNPSGFANLLFESIADVAAGSQNIIRVYTFADAIFVTSNAKLVSNVTSATAFGRDSDTADSSLLEYSTSNGTLSLSFWRAADASTWPRASWKNAVFLDPKGASATQDLVRLGDALLANSTDSLKPRIGTGVGDNLRLLLYEARGSGGGSGLYPPVRVYIETSDDSSIKSALTITVNAKWDGSQWSKEDPAQRSLKYVFSSNSFEVAVRNTAAPWNDTLWESDQIFVDFSQFIAYFGGTLDIGGEAVDPHQPRIAVARVLPNVNRRTLLFESPQGGPFAQIPLRLYLGSGSSSAFGDSFMFTYNARWDQNLDKFVQDVPTFNSYGLVFGSPALTLLRKANASANWSEAISSWDGYDSLSTIPGGTGFQTQDGTFRVDRTAANIAGATAPLTNAIYAKSMIKSWGKVKGDGPFTNNVSLMDGFNCNFTGYDGGAGAYANYFATAMLDTNYAVLFSGRASNYTYPTPPTEPGSYFVWSGSRIHLYSAVLIGQATYGYSYYTLNGANGVPNAGLGDIRGYFMYFVVVGSQ